MKIRKKELLGGSELTYPNLGKIVKIVALSFPISFGSRVPLASSSKSWKIAALLWNSRIFEKIFLWGILCSKEIVYICFPPVMHPLIYLSLEQESLWNGTKHDTFHVISLLSMTFSSVSCHAIQYLHQNICKVVIVLFCFPQTWLLASSQRDKFCSVIMFSKCSLDRSWLALTLHHGTPFKLRSFNFWSFVIEDGSKEKQLPFTYKFCRLERLPISSGKNVSWRLWA